MNTDTMNPATEKLTMIEAINLALQHEMQRDEDVVLLGEDIGRNGGVFRATINLQQQFGPQRVIDTPLAETLIAGLTVGMATQGLKPVAEIQFMGFIYATFEQLVSHAARLRHRTRSRLHCPMVLRAPFGGGIHAPEHHSESTEAMLAHIPGLRVVIPSSPRRAYGLILAAIRDPDPVIFLEPKRIYRAVKHTLADDGEALPLDTCFTLRPGTDLTLISWGAMVMESLQAARELEQEGIDVEVIDVATIKPLDMATILTSVRKTGRCVIAHEAARSFGAGAEIAAQIGEHAMSHLRAPVVRVSGYDTIMPLLKNEDRYMPHSADITAAIKQVMAI
jgi:pyruvate dehydrogenase E1 component beta subunit